MLYYLRLSILLTLSAGVAFAQHNEADRGAELLKPFKLELMQALQAGLAQGPAEAISACRIEAPQIAQSLSTDGVRMGRTSHRLRNPANTAPDWVTPVLDDYLADVAGRLPRRVDLPGGMHGYIEPIGIKPLCLACHGEALAPEVAVRIGELYPKDRATGFTEGDLRGVFWVEYPVSD
jgi:hypothetical protein